MDLLRGTPATLGESPLWVDGSELAYVDMLGGTVHRVDLTTGGTTVRQVAPPPVPYLGAVVETAAGGLAAVTLRGVVTVPTGSDEYPEALVTIVEDTQLRLNDAAVDPQGRLWVGSTSVTGEVGRGSLHIWAPGTPAETVLDGLTLPNGIGWSPDGTVAYVVDSHARAIFAATLDARTGAVGEFAHFADTGEDGQPDGLAVAVDGSIWVAVWDGGCVRRFAPDGSRQASISLPVTRPTACAFGDRELFVTTARHGLSDADLAAQPLAGRVLRLPVDIAGVGTGRLAA